MLRIMEEPPPFLYFALCTTDPTKIPDTIKQRCYQVRLEPVNLKEVGQLVEYIAMSEDWTISDEIFTIIMQECEGSPRKAIALLQALRTAKNRDEAARIMLLEHGENEPSKVLSRLLFMGSKDWPHVQRLLKQLDDEMADWEQVYIGVCRYMTAVMTKTIKEDDAGRASQVLILLTMPTNGYDPKAAFFAAVSRVFWS